ncbi:hypothetical protein FHY18_000268 [Xanthomonas arboricola]|uniref:hypothetical protein n=1 Tax=Xanthomonas sp. 3793 TaxID=3035312 RepID=UPI002167983A|nr:hypothetical protein [Xanthomonas sp. 3793]MCS3744738.1 hypothetical protein [Xanthomonas sp. 3793]
MTLSFQLTGAVVRGGVTAGRSSELGWPHVYCDNFPAKIYFDARYDTLIHTYGTDVHELQK